MNRSATQKPKYKETEYKKKKLICDSSLSPQRAFFEESEDDAAYSGKLTRSDDTEDSYVQFKGLEWDAIDNYIQPKPFDKMNTANNFLYHSYYADVRNHKQDKNTQKNLLSPFPSFLKTPIYRETSTSHKYALPTVQSLGDKNFLDKSSGKISRNMPNFGDKNDTICFHHYHRERFNNKLCDKHKIQTESELLASKTEQYKSNIADISVPVKLTAEPDNNQKSSNESSENDVNLKGPKSSARVAEAGKCLDCFRMNFIQTDPGRRGTVKPYDSEKELLVHDSYMTKNSIECAAKEHPNARKPPTEGKVREKLVYVVEEEGKEGSQLETDLFSVNEILAIKKDLLELSDFAKKLKKLKEIKKKNDKGKNNGQCQCRPVAEVLVDVNRRIAALEARQEELERGSQRSGKKGDTELESKTTDVDKTTTDSPPKTPPVTNKQSAMTSTPSFPKTDMIVSRAEGFSNNSEIVNELMDIRTQLQRLEKRRMSQEVPAEVEPLGDLKQEKKKGHAIAVFSSRTYILTPEKYEKKKEQKLINIGNKKVVDSIDLIPTRLKSEKYENSSKINRFSPGAKENVTNWLKNVTVNNESSSHEFGVFVAAETPVQTITTPYEGAEMKTDESQAKCKKCAQLKHQEFESQEQKNRATEKEVEKDEVDRMVPIKEVSIKSPGPSIRPQIQCKECVMTPSGRILTFSARAGPSPKFTLDTRPETCRTPETPGESPPKVVRTSFSSSSIPSVVVTKEQIEKLTKTEGPVVKRKEETQTQTQTHTDFSTSKSLQELTSTTTTTKGQKTAINTKKKHHEKNVDKKNKESKNELVKREIEKILRKRFDIETTSPTSPTTTTTTTEVSEMKKSCDSECYKNLTKRKRHNKSDVSSVSEVTEESSSPEEESSEETETETESETESSRSIRRKSKERRKRDECRRSKERERWKFVDSEKHKKYEPEYGKSRICRLGKCRNKKKYKWPRRKKNVRSEEEEEDEFDTYSVYNLSKKMESNPFGSKSGILSPVVMCCAEKKKKCNVCKIKCKEVKCKEPKCKEPKSKGSKRKTATIKCCSEVKSSCSCSAAKEPPPTPPPPPVRPPADGDSFNYCHKETECHDNHSAHEKNCPNEQPSCIHICRKKKPKCEKVELPKPCKCVKIFLAQQSHQQDWPGVQPFDTKSFKHMSEGSISSSPCISEVDEERYTKQPYFPARNPAVYCVDGEDALEPPCDCSEMIRKKKKKKKCVCSKCGNVHKKKKGAEESDSELERQNCEQMFDEMFAGRAPPKGGFQMKPQKTPKTRELKPPKSKSSIFQRLAEVRRIKTCKIKKKIRQMKGKVRPSRGPPAPARPPPPRMPPGKPKPGGKTLPRPPMGPVNLNKKRCDCDPKWVDIEHRVHALETSNKKIKERSYKKKMRSAKEEAGRKHRKIKKALADCEKSCGKGGGGGGNCKCCTCSDGKTFKAHEMKEIKEKKTPGKKFDHKDETKKGKKRLSCKKYCRHEEKFHSKYGPRPCQSNENNRAEKEAFVEKCQKQKKETRQIADEQKKAAVHATYCCTCEEEGAPFKIPEEECPESANSPSVDAKIDTCKKKRSLLEKFSSISSVIKNWRCNHQRVKPLASCNAEIGLLNDASRSGILPQEKSINTCLDGPVFFGRRRKKMMSKSPCQPKLSRKDLREIKRRDKLEKKERREREKKVSKTKSKTKRHKFK